MPILIVIVILVTGLVIGLKRSDTRRKAEVAAKEAELRRQHAQKEREAAQRVTAEIGGMESAVSDFTDLTSGQSYVRHRRLVKHMERHRDVLSLARTGCSPNLLDSRTLTAVTSLLNYAEQGEALVGAANRAFTLAECERFRPLFDSIESHPLNSSQREAIVHDEDANLVVAGAGTGKTSSIVGKVAYLLNSGAAKPEDILLLAFTRKAAEEMSNRICSRIGLQASGVAVRTFHGFGLEIIAQARGEKPSLAFDDRAGTDQFRVLAEAFDRLCQDEGYARRAVDYFAYLLQPVFTSKSFDSSGEYYRYLKSQQPLHLKGERVAMRGEELRSFDEVDIANFLFTHGVEYEYEAEYRVRTASVGHRQYTPDFYLPEYEIYIEHFAVDRAGNVPDWFSSRNGKSASRAYADDMAWKRQVHRENKTQLIETYAYEKQEDVLLPNLQRQLEQHGVVLHERSSVELMRQLKAHALKPVPLLVKFMATFLELTKSNGFDMAGLRLNVGRLNSPQRAAAFLEGASGFVGGFFIERIADSCQGRRNGTGCQS